MKRKKYEFLHQFINWIHQTSDKISQEKKRDDNTIASGKLWHVQKNMKITIIFESISRRKMNKPMTEYEVYHDVVSL